MGSTSRGIVLRAGTRIGHTACVSMSAADVFKRMLRDEVAAALRATGLRVGCDLPDAERVTLGSARLPGSDGE